ncbi:MAG: hypothetical protein ACFFBY_04555 [Promethearchaeota archaeon]
MSVLFPWQNKELKEKQTLRETRFEISIYAIQFNNISGNNIILDIQKT